MIIILLSRIWGAVLSILLVPIYVKLLGIESYGLVAFYATLSGALAILDVGLSASIIRQVAIYKTQTNNEKELKNLIFTVEVINWLIAVVLGISIVLLANPIAVNWVKANQIDSQTIQQSIILMGVVFAFQFPVSVYDGALVGLQQQNANAILNLIFTTVKAVGVLILLYFLKPTIELYFIWQVVITILYTFAMRAFVYKKVNAPHIKSIFSITELKVIWRFAAGIAATSIVIFFITQVDKIIVSRNLEQLSYYSLAFLLASGITAIISPLQTIIYPKLTQFVTTQNDKALIELYHKSCKWISIIVFPIGFTLIIFAKDILLLWTKNELLTTNTAPILQIVVAGTICNCLMIVPYYLTLAKGNPKYGLYQNIIAAIILVPLLLVWYKKYGALGASFVWLVVNASCLLISLPILTKLYIKNQYLHWLKNDIIQPLVFAIIIIFLAKFIQTKFIHDLNFLLFILLITISYLVYVLSIPETRAFFYKNVAFVRQNIKKY